VKLLFFPQKLIQEKPVSIIFSVEIPLEHVLPKGRSWDTLAFSHLTWNWSPSLELWQEGKPAPNRSLTLYQGVSITLIQLSECTNGRRRCNFHYHL